MAAYYSVPQPPYRRNIPAISQLPRTISTTNLETTRQCWELIQKDWCPDAPFGGTSFFVTLPQYTFTIPSLSSYPPEFCQFMFNRIIDRTAKKSLEEEKCLNWCPQVTKLEPMYTLGDGNCLLHAASLGMWGIQDRAKILRNAVSHAALNAGTNNTFYRRWRYTRSMEYQQIGLQLDRHQWQKEWQDIVRQASTDLTTNSTLESLEEFHVFVLSNVLRRPVIIYASQKMHSVHTGGTLQHTNFHGIYLPLLWDPQLCCKVPLPLAYQEGHFSNLVLDNFAGDGKLVLPLVTYTQDRLPVRFILQVENPEHLIREYLSLITIPRSDHQGNILCATGNISIKPRFYDHLVTSFIDVCHDTFIQQQQQQQQPPSQVGSRNQGCSVVEQMRKLELSPQIDLDTVERLTQERKEMEGKLLEAENRASEAEERSAVMEGRWKEIDRQLKAEEGRSNEVRRQLKEMERKWKEEEGRSKEMEQQLREVEGQLWEMEGRWRDTEETANTLQHQLKQNEDPFWMVEQGEICLTERELGRGGWGTVKVAEFRGLQVAAKCLHSIIISDYNRQLFVREMSIAAKLRHPNLIQFIGATMEGEPIILTELMATSLRAVIEREPLSEANITSISRDIARALNYLHLTKPNPILHRDVSSANVLLNLGPNMTWLAKLSDYGSANFVQQVTTAGPGNPAYAAPEASNPSQQSPKMDVFSYGVLLVEMATRRFPDKATLILQIKEIRVPGLQGVIRQCIQRDPARRPNIGDLLTQL